MLQIVSDYYASLREQCPGRISASLGLVALFVYAIFWLWSIDTSRQGEGLLILAFLIVLVSNKPTGLKWEPLGLLFVVWLLYQIPVYLFAAAQFPEIAADQITVARHYSKIFMVLVVAWWLAGSTRSIVLVYLLAFIGFVCGALFVGQGLDEAVDLIHRQKRMDLGFRNAQHLAVYASFFLLVVVFFWRRLTGMFPPRWRWGGYLLVLLWLMFTLFVVIASGTRASWIALVFLALTAGSVYLLLLVRKMLQGDRAQRRRGVVVSTSVALAVVLLGVLLARLDTMKLLERRFTKESEAIQYLLDGNIADMPYSSVGTRIHTWEKAVGLIMQRPMTGWGPKSRKLLIDQSDLPKRIKRRYGHFHNSYIEITLAYGLMGLGLVGLLVGIVGYRTWWAWRRGLMPDDAFYFFSAFFIYWAIVNMAESYVIYSSGYYINALVGGGAYTFYLAARRRDAQNHDG